MGEDQSMAEVVLELADPGGCWHRVGSVAEVEPLGSISVEGTRGRHVYVFGWLDETVGVWRSRGGVDVAGRLVRMVYTTGLDPLADLTEGTFEIDRVTPTGPPQRVRFRLAPND